MIVVERTCAVAAAPAAVVAYLRDLANAPRWDPGCRGATRTGDGPIGPGTSWRQVCRVLGVSAELTRTLITMEPGRLVFHGGNEGATCTDTVTVRPAGAGAEVTYRVELEMHGLAKLATPVLKIEFEKLGTAAADGLTTALNALAPPAGENTTEVRFPGSARPAPTARGQEAQA